MARAALLAALAAMALVALGATQDSRPVPDVADAAIARDRAERAAARAAGRSPATPRPPGFFGTIKQIVVDSVNDTKSAYQQISGLVNNQFSDTATAPPPPPPGSNATTTAAPPRVSRAEFLRILDRNIKGLRRLYNLEISEAFKPLNVQPLTEMDGGVLFLGRNTTATHIQNRIKIVIPRGRSMILAQTSASINFRHPEIKFDGSNKM